MMFRFAATLSVAGLVHAHRRLEKSEISLSTSSEQVRDFLIEVGYSNQSSEWAAAEAAELVDEDSENSGEERRKYAFHLLQMDESAGSQDYELDTDDATDESEKYDAWHGLLGDAHKNDDPHVGILADYSFLGPLPDTFCGGGSIRSRGAVHRGNAADCTRFCQGACQVVSHRGSQCEYFSHCNPVRTPGTSVLVKNTEGIQPHYIPPRTVSGDHKHFFVLGDWGGITSQPGRGSMHYVHKGFRPGSKRWSLDHHAQENVGRQMGAFGRQLKPFMVVNAGDNFYWGGVFPWNGGVHDASTWTKGFENVYTDSSIKNIPWIGILGNHDYGGEGCISDVKSQFDYTTLDMMKNKRWKMPSPYYNHQVNFDGFSAEFFMLDSNVEDYNVGRAGPGGGICGQILCLRYYNRFVQGRLHANPASCKKYFMDIVRKQKKWLHEKLAASTADWKIVVLHHKPAGEVLNMIRDAVNQNGVQLVIGSHTHEMAYFKKWRSLQAPLLVVGAGGGAQGNPGCGGGEFCSTPTGYGFADVAINGYEMTVKIIDHAGKENFKTTLSV